MSEKDRRYISFDELLAYTEEIVAKEAQEESVRRKEEAEEALMVDIDLESGQPGSDNHELYRLFRALAHETRLEILELLLARPATAGQIASELDARPDHLSRHLRVLEAAGLVAVERSGVTKIFRPRERAMALLTAAVRK